MGCEKSKRKLNWKVDMGNKGVAGGIKRCLQIFGVVAILAMFMGSRAAAQNLAAEPPVEFFTNVASRLLSAQLNVKLTQIQIYPTNQYTPAVHRLLQVAANLYDASTNRYYDQATPSVALPTVFKPVFRKVPAGSNYDIYLDGFVEVTNLDFLANPIRSLNGGASVAAALQPNDLAFGVPLIIGAKKRAAEFQRI
jgi:hypothetical protein